MLLICLVVLFELLVGFMDKDWVKLDRNCPQYRLALSNFIDNSIRVAGHDGAIKCPCKKCYNTSWEMPETVRKHMRVYGMDLVYQNGVWREHGEPLQQPNNPTGFPNVPPFEINVPDCGMLDMLNDAFHEEHTSVNSDVEPDPPSEPTPEAANFFNLLKEADMDIYPGCTRMKKLDFLVHAFKIKCLYKVSDVALTEFLLLFKSILPKGETLPKSFYLARKLISDLGLNYEKIDACPNDCMIYWKDRASFLFCPDCGESRYKNNKSPNSNGKECKVPQKVLRYFPLAPRLQRLYMNHQTSKEMTWHATDRPTDGVMRHPADSPAWKHLDNKFPVFSNEIRNVQLGLASDGFNPFGNMSNAHSTWPVVLSVYNLAPWLCMKRPYLILSLLIPGPRGPGKDIDVYLEPLVDELKKLWEDGITSYDAYRKQQFTLRAAILWTISDFPAYAMLSGWSTKGKLACPNCNHGTCSKWLNHGHKYCYMGHRRFLPNGHPFRQEASLFDNTIELREAPVPLTGTECLEELSHLTFRFGKGKPPPQQKNKNKRKRSTAESNGGKKICSPWKQKSIFFDLPYWEHLLLRHNLDVMHIEKNVFDSVLGTILGIPGKSKDSLNARLDMDVMHIEKGVVLHEVMK